MSYTAMVCEALEGPGALKPHTLDEVMPAAGEVRIGIRAAGVNFPDLLMTRGAYQLKLQPPFTPGMEIAGEILATGAKVTDWQPGQRVIALMRHGGYAQQAVVPAAALLPLPQAFSWAEGATFHVATHTAWHALVDRARLAAGETLLVLGATGGVGLAAVALGKTLGARVIAVGGDDGKLAVARQQGADAVVNYRTQDLLASVKALTEERGVDVVYDPVGGELSKTSARLLAWDGRLLIIGFASGEIPEFRANHALIKGYSILGVRAGESSRRNPEQARRGREAILDHARNGHLRPYISHTLPLTQAGQALQLLESRQVTGRVALVIDDE